MSDLAELQSQAAAADAERSRLAIELAQAEAEAESRAMAAMTRREAEVAAATAEWLQSYDEQAEALQAEETRLRQAFLDELADAPWARAWVAYRAARWRRQNLSTDAHNAGSRLGHDRLTFELPYRDPRLLSDLVDHLETAARSVAADEVDARHVDLGW